MFDNDDERYQALCERNPAAEGMFLYCVVSTKIFCRPTCSSKLAKRQNVIFVNNSDEALKLGYRPCKRCKPDLVKDWNNSRRFILKACTLIYQRSKVDSALDVELILHNIGVSKWHFFRTFKTYTGLTPRQFFRQCVTLKVDPLLLSPLPPIQTRKNTQLRKQVSKNRQETNIDESKDGAGYGYNGDSTDSVSSTMVLTGTPPDDSSDGFIEPLYMGEHLADFYDLMTTFTDADS